MPMRKLHKILGALFVALAVAMPALAMDLDEARSKGLLGEQADGYVGIVGQSTPELQQLAADINAKRKAHYEEIAANNKTSPEAVAALAGKKLVEGRPAGEYVKTNGGWTKK
jgi:uncharacterized protein YdbL (DUF1318 family)